MSKWMMAVLFGLQAHFAASYLVPLDARSQRELGGLLRWLWPWADGDGGLVGRLTVGGELPLPGLLLANGAALLFGLAALAALGLWVPTGWLRTLVAFGAVLLLCLVGLFLSPTKLLPFAFAVATLYAVVACPTMFAAS